MLIEYATQPEAREAIKGLDNTKFLEQTIGVDYAFVRPPPKEKGRGEGGRGGRRGGRARSRSRSKSRERERSRSKSEGKGEDVKMD